jgi:hypothetical protein
MRTSRIACGTRRSLWVTARGLGLCLIGAAAAPLHAEDLAPVDLAKELRRAAYEHDTDAAKRALSVPSGGDATLWAVAGANLLRNDPEVAVWLIRRAFLEDPAPRGFRTSRRPAGIVDAPAMRLGGWLLDTVKDGTPEEVARALAIIGVAERGGLDPELTNSWPPSRFVRTVLEDEVGRVATPDGTFWLANGDARAVRTLLESVHATAGELDDACSDDPRTAESGLDALLARGKGALPLLLHEVRRAAEGVPPGRVLRCVQAITALGIIGDRAATGPLMACMESLNGWIRVTAATALGDLGDPAAAVVLARQLAYAGDPFRKFESWDYPGTTETTVAPEDWNGVDYYVVDAAAADALLAMGSRGAVGWLLKNDLDPKRRNVRIRVIQDALDCLKRHLPEAPTADYLPDGGLPQRHAAFEKLEAWWRAHRDDPGLLKKTFDEQDPGFVKAARELAERLTQQKVLELMIAKDSAEVLGAPLTPALLEALATAKGPGAKVELAQALMRVRDPRAVPALLGLLEEKAAFLRAAGAGALVTYAARGAPEVIEALVAGLASPDCGVAVASMQSLVAAPPSDLVRQALAANDEAAFEKRCGADANYAMAAKVVRLVQEGQVHWPEVEAGLASPDRVVRRSWWDLLRLALDLYEHLYDPIPPPTAPEWRAVDETKVLEALRARRSK